MTLVGKSHRSILTILGGGPIFSTRCTKSRSALITAENSDPLAQLKINVSDLKAGKEIGKVLN